jgi:hypothetical protein
MLRRAGDKSPGTRNAIAKLACVRTNAQAMELANSTTIADATLELMARPSGLVLIALSALAPRISLGLEVL